MGICNSNGKNNVKSAIENERYVKIGEKITLENSILLNEIVKNSLCEVIMDFNDYGTGFICKIKSKNN